MALIAFAAPVLPGKMDQLRSFTAECTGPRREEFEASRRRYGVRERTFLQQTPMGATVIVTVEGDDLQGFMRDSATSETAFAQWMRGQLLEIEGIDFSHPGQPPELIADSGEVPAQPMTAR